MSEPTTIHWLTLPRNGNGGAALVTWRQSTQDSMVDYWHKRIDYLLGDKPPRYPVPAIHCEPLCCFCGSISGDCNRFPQNCYDDEYRHWEHFHSMN